MKGVTIDRLITELKKARETHGGDHPVVIHDSGTEWDLACCGLEQAADGDGPSVVRLIPEPYADYLKQ